jgi:hypothetical protein
MSSTRGGATNSYLYIACEDERGESQIQGGGTVVDVRYNHIHGILHQFCFRPKYGWESWPSKIISGLLFCFRKRQFYLLDRHLDEFMIPP